MSAATGAAMEPTMPDRVPVPARFRFPAPARATARTAGPLLAALALTVPAAAQTAGTAPAALACTGPFARDGSHARLAAAFGAANVAFEEVDGAEGERLKASVVHGKDPARRITVFWRDDDKRAGVAGVTVSTPSAWSGPLGLRNGMGLAEVERLNGAPFNINGFEWDGGGYVANLTGRLATLPGGCGLAMRFSPSVELKGRKWDPIIGDKEVTSSSALMRAARPVLTEWSLGWGE